MADENLLPVPMDSEERIGYEKQQAIAKYGLPEDAPNADIQQAYTTYFLGLSKDASLQEVEQALDEQRRKSALKHGLPEDMSRTDIIRHMTGRLKPQSWQR